MIAALRRDGERERRIVVYSCAGGAAFARKTVETGRTPQAPDFELFDARLAYREG